MSQSIEYKICDRCLRKVKLQGLGSSATPTKEFLRKLIGFLWPITTKVFRPASDFHDMAVHKGPIFGRSFEKWVEEVDNAFYNVCVEIVKKRPFWQRNYLLLKASECHLALKMNAGKDYPKVPCTCTSRQGEVE